MKVRTHAVIADFCPDSDFDLIRELLSYDALCPTSTIFTRTKLGRVVQANPPSPLHWSRQCEWPWVIRNAELIPEHSVLDIGSGWSILKFALASRCKSVTCLESNPEFVAKAQIAIDLIAPHKIKQVHGDARNIPFLDNSFDRVFLVSVIEHIPEGHLKAVQEAKRVTKLGGCLLITMDVAYEGKVGDGDFYLDLDGAKHILGELGIPGTDNEPKIMGAVMDGRTNVLVIMICWVKPDESK